MAFRGHKNGCCCPTSSSSSSSTSSSSSSTSSSFSLEEGSCVHCVSFNAPRHWMAIVSGFSTPANGCQNCGTFNRTVILDDPDFPGNEHSICLWRIDFDPALDAKPCTVCGNGSGIFSVAYILQITKAINMGITTFTYTFGTITNRSGVGIAALTQSEADFDCHYSGPLIDVSTNHDPNCSIGSPPSITGPGCHIDLNVSIHPV